MERTSGIGLTEKLTEKGTGAANCKMCVRLDSRGMAATPTQRRVGFCCYVEV